MKKIILSVLISATLMCVLTVSTFAASYKRGDVDMNGSVNANDCVKLRKILLSIEDETETSDINQDGATDIKDLVSLKKLLANPETSIIIPGGNGDKTVINDNWD